MTVEVDKNLMYWNVTHNEDDHVSIVENTCSYTDFVNNYLRGNKPCIIKDVATNWNASKCWTENNCPNFEYLKSKYGECNVTIYDCQEKYYNSQKTKQSLLKEYLNYWIDFRKTNGMPLYYLKDWHLKNQFPQDDFYEVPIYFASDWLNEYLCESNKDDYRFVYMGPKGTWSPFHVDVFTSYSWSVNVCGQKRWVLFPPGAEICLKDSLGNLPYDITHIGNDVKCYDFVQNARDAVFVPSGWYHQVWNLKDTVSVNHNWINACNINTMWTSLDDNLKDVKKEIEDCKDMNNYLEHCQIMLKASYGLNFQEFYEFVKYIAMKRMEFLNKNVSVNLFHGRTLGKYHALFDLKSIENVLAMMSQHEDVNKLSEIIDNETTPVHLLYNVKMCVKNNNI